MTAPSSSPRGEHAPRPGTGWETRLAWTGEEHLADGAEPPRPNRATRRAAARAARRRLRPVQPPGLPEPRPPADSPRDDHTDPKERR
ncbi:hypothetical protein [Streptomyces sp. DH37]|uniref:hypothetical protein n=1 Tax=Streptomyces sp. DH37 TaxID=3040122 RepID=UPI0024426BF5|nr:hypothetical protein [Streptomyces sp. DH37]MDG9701705.1 hypothetical protein [Streptomyces sp. DH37]